MKCFVVLAMCVGCFGGASSVPQPAAPAGPVPPLLLRVGPKPRGYATVGLAADGWVRNQLESVSAALPMILGKSLADCNIDLARVERLRVAIGEPLRIAAELDGKIDVAAVSCLVGDELLAAAAGSGLVLRDRAGGIAIDYNAQRGDSDTATAAIAAKCATPDCAAVRVGPAARSVWVTAALGAKLRFQLEGPGIAAAGAALLSALAELRPTVPVLARVKLDVRGDALAFENVVGTEGTEALAAELATALREHVIEAFRIPSSSMAPTLQIGDHIFAVKGPLAKRLTAGDILVYRATETRDYIFRYLTGGPATVSESDAGISINGKLLLRQVVEPAAKYRDFDDDTGESYEKSGEIVREQLGSRRYLTFRNGPPRLPGPWTVPPGTMFVAGDNRTNANDSRYNPPPPLDRLRGRAVAIWWATNDGIPAWNRIGTAIE